MSQRWSSYTDDELREIIADARRDAEGPDGMIRVCLPTGANYFLMDPTSHLVVMHRSKIVDMTDALDDLSTEVVRLRSATDVRHGTNGNRRRTMYIPPDLLKENREKTCADARGPHLTSLYRCGSCPACTAEGLSQETLDDGMPCGFFCDCVPGYDKAVDAIESEEARPPARILRILAEIRAARQERTELRALRLDLINVLAFRVSHSA